jgi:mannan endo-1,4-beta-mannosidase
MTHRRGRGQSKALQIVMAGSAVIVLAAVIVVAVRHDKPGPVHHRPTGNLALSRSLPRTPETYLGVYATRGHVSYTGVRAFARATGVTPNVATYYSAWFEPFMTRFAGAAAEHGAVPLVQIDPTHVSLAAIAAGKYDAYLSDYAAAVKAYRHPVILSFGHEMNGQWFPWGYRHTSPVTFVAAWRHIVTLFRALGARNVTWLWTVNIIHSRTGRSPDPGPWWPGSSYVNWVGIDGYYYGPSYAFAPLFGPTIVKVRRLTRLPILIAETAAAPAAGQAAKIADLFKGIREYGLLGFVWFNASHIRDWRISSPAAAAALRQGAKTYKLRKP